MTAERTLEDWAAAHPGSDAAPKDREIATLPIDALDWKRFVHSQEGALAYHDPAWGLMLAECYGFRPFALGLVGGGRILAGVPVVETRTLRRRRRWISLPFTDHCPPLGVTASASREFAAGLDGFRRHASVERLDIHADVSGPSTFNHVGRIHPCRRPHCGERLALRRTRPFAGSARYQALATRRRRDQARRPGDAT